MSANVVPLRPAYGASPDAWAHFELLVGAADLLPVVSNPNAVISEQSTLKTLGKTPSVYNQHRRVAGLPGWSKKVSTPAEVERWSREPDYGICIQTRRVRGLDIDVPDADLADQIDREFRTALGSAALQLPARTRADTGKRLLAFEIVGSLSKRSFKVEGGLVEFLADGQQFVAAGTHPSGARYEWANGLPDTFPSVSQAVFEQAWAAIVEQFALAPATDGEAGADRSRPDFEAEDAVADYLHDQGLVISEQGEKLFVACPWKAGHTSDSGISETCWLRAGTRGFERGHFQCMHASCAARADEDFLDAVGFRVSAFRNLDEDRDTERQPDVTVPRSQGTPAGEADPFDITDPWPRLKRDGNGRIEAVIGNVELALARPDMCKAILRFDLFRDELMVEWEDDRTVRPLTDADAVRLRVELEARGFKPVGRELMRDGLLLQARDNTFDSAQGWLAGLPAWDGVERVERFFPQLCTTDDSAYTRACGRYFWTALAGRVLSPGCQVDMVPILQSDEQGKLKSSLVEEIAPPELEGYRKINLDKIGDDNLARSLRGCIVGEIDEMRGLRTRDAESIRSWITQRFERWVRKFQERETTFKRRCVFMATANPKALLDDETGERRWLPMALRGTVDLDGFRAVRDQLWAEGRFLFEMGGVDWQEAEALARYEHAAFKVRDERAPVILRWLDTPCFGDADMAAQTYYNRGWVLLADVAEGAFGVRGTGFSLAYQRDLGKVMRDLGWEPGPKKVDGKQLHVWQRRGG